MADPRIGRFFSLKALLAAVVVFLLGFGAGAYTVYLFMFENLISFTFGLLTLALFLGGVGALTLVFPTGCKACKKKFESTSMAFPPDHFNFLVQAFQSGNHESIAQLAASPMGDPTGQKAIIDLRYCASCRNLAEADITVQHWTGQYNKTDHQHPTLVLSGPAVEAAVCIADQQIRALNHGMK